MEADGADSAPELSEPEPEPSEPEPEPELSEPPAAYAEPDDGSEVVTSPVPGTVLELKVDVGTAVKRGDSLMVLEAMKMEYEINASSDGTVTQIFTSVGAAVEAGTPLIVIL
ncbi:MAG: biotin/lipoyl-binding protein [Clostridiales bacterium]|nr:biotin/lipoyl-binding protein [Clostridiales bacterium]